MSKDEKTPRRIALEEINAERNHHVRDEGWTDEYDDTQNRGNQLPKAAALYALSSVYNPDSPLLSRIFHSVWPSSWDRVWWKPWKKSQRRRLIVAGALIVAQLELLTRQGITE